MGQGKVVLYSKTGGVICLEVVLNYTKVMNLLIS